MKRISFSDIIRQLKKDLIGKDSFRGVTLTYSWLANQFGHFSLGFIPTVIVFAILKYWCHIDEAALWAAGGVSAFWFLFELYNFLGPLLSKSQSKSNLLFIPGKKYTFTPPWGNIAFDTFTDLCFFWIGAFAAAVFCDLSTAVLVVLIIASLLSIYPSCYWYRTKMYLQEANYPFQFRLSQWDMRISEINKDRVNKYRKNKYSGNHLLIFGTKKSGKTSLGVGIGTEFSIKHYDCVYVTAIKLLSMFYEPDENLMNLSDSLWTWRTSSLLVIDDINPGDPIMDEIITPESFYKFLNNDKFGSDNIRAIKDKNVIWILGNEGLPEMLQQKWEALLEKIGVGKTEVIAINLSKV